MKHFILLVLLNVISFSASAQLADSATNTNPCRYQGAGRTPVIEWSPNDSLIESLGLSPEDRMSIVCDMKRSFQDKYALYYLKKELVGVDLDVLFNTCATRELSIADTSRMAFHDRILQCISQIHDSHISPRLASGRPYVTTLISVYQVQGKVIVSSLNRTLIAKIKTDTQVPDDFDDILKVGNEVLAIDGVAPATLAKTYSQFGGASSEAFALERGFQAITERSYSYPTKPFLSVQIKKADGTLRNLALPWFVDSKTSADIEAQNYFAKLNLRSINDVIWSYNKATQKFEKADDAYDQLGYAPGYPLFDLQKLEVYSAENKSPVFRFGLMAGVAEKPFCYLQIRTFSEGRAKLDSEKDYASFPDVFTKLVSRCRDFQVPMILDLRTNPGGNGELPAFVAATLARTGEKTVSVASSARANRHTAQRMSQIFGKERAGFADLDQNDGFTESALEAFKSAVQNKKPYMDWVYSGDLDVNKDVGGYNGKIIALITPNCVSACDMTSRLLYNSGRATLVGTTANGTGAGFASEDAAAPDFADAYGLFKFSIPNHMFTVLTQKTNATTLDFDSNHSLIMENHPTPANIRYDFTTKDITNKLEDLRKKTLELLFQKDSGKASLSRSI